MVIKFRKKELNIPWEYLAAPFLIVLAFVVVISYRAGGRSEELIAVSAPTAAVVSAVPENPATATDAQIPYDEPEPGDNTSGGACAAEQPSSDESAVTQKVNINKAGMDELDTLPNIGPVKAKAIIDYRNANGPFKSAEDLLNVKGIGPKTLEKLRDLITLE